MFIFLPRVILLLLSQKNKTKLDNFWNIYLFTTAKPGNVSIDIQNKKYTCSFKKTVEKMIPQTGYLSTFVDFCLI